MPQILIYDTCMAVNFTDVLFLIKYFMTAVVPVQAVYK
jgi:hypothetical protein